MTLVEESPTTTEAAAEEFHHYACCMEVQIWQEGGPHPQRALCGADISDGEYGPQIKIACPACLSTEVTMGWKCPRLGIECPG